VVHGTMYDVRRPLLSASRDDVFLADGFARPAAPLLRQPQRRSAGGTSDDRRVDLCTVCGRVRVRPSSPPQAKMPEPPKRGARHSHSRVGPLLVAVTNRAIVSRSRALVRRDIHRPPACATTSLLPAQDPRWSDRICARWAMQAARRISRSVQSTSRCSPRVMPTARWVHTARRVDLLHWCG
jgi:hypothetical protein